MLSCSPSLLEGKPEKRSGHPLITNSSFLLSWSYRKNQQVRQGIVWLNVLKAVLGPEKSRAWITSWFQCSFMLKWQENRLPAESGFLQRAAYSFWGWLTPGKQSWCKCWPHTNRLRDISPAEMGLLRLRVCNFSSGSATMEGHVQTPLQPGKEKSFRERKKRSWKGSSKPWFSPWLFTGGVIARKESFFFLQGSEMVTGGDSSPF